MSEPYATMLNWLQIAFVYSYGIPLLLINLRTIYVLKTRYLEFSSAYYKFFFISGINDCLLYILNNGFIRFPGIKLFYDLFFHKFSEFSWWLTFPRFMIVYCSYFTHIGTLILSANRFTAVYLYLDHEQIWFDFENYVICGLFIIPALFSSQSLFTEYKYEIIVRESDNQTFVAARLFRHFDLWNVDYVSSISVGLFTLAGLVINLTTIILWHMRERAIPVQHRSYERSMIILTLVVYTAHLISFLYNLARSLIWLDVINVYLAYLVVSDLVALLPTFSIVLVAPSVRKCVFSIFPDFCKYFGMLRKLCGKRKVEADSNARGIDNIVMRFSDLNELDQRC